MKEQINDTGNNVMEQERETLKPCVFISYARTDLQSAQNLEKIFLAEGFPVWRDQDSIEPGEHWPEAIGQAIAGHSIFLLLWSKPAADSPVVKFEWNTALALQKTIVPVFLDKTPLPAALKSLSGVFLHDPVNTVKKILELTAKLSSSRPRTSSLPNDNLPGSGPGPGIPGIPTAPAKWWDKWQAKVAFFIVLLTLLTFVLDIPEKAKNFYREIFGEPAVTCTLKGVVLDSRQIPVSGVQVTVDKLPGQPVKSIRTGSFKWEKVPGEIGGSVRVTAYYNGRMVWDEYVALPGPVRIILEEQ